MWRTLTHRRSVLAAVFVSACVSVVVGSAQTPAAAADKELRYVSTEALAPEALLPPPVGDPSEAQAELADVRRVIAGRTPERLAAAKWDDEHEDASLYGPTLGPRFDLKALPATAELMSIVQDDALAAGKLAKRHFARKRPWAVDPTIPNCDPDDKPTTSYPSGHAMIGYSTGLVLAELLPNKAEVIMTRAQDYAFSRVVCGAHYPSDTRASQALSAYLIATLQRDPEFRAKLEAARAELRAADLAR